ncbi:hypothetical protein, partial [Enterococcus faecium]|uniref:hypothetical protein n=1 Tax=Enterococcus faecium TaxID=1352 RepID=UPI0039FBF267
KNTGEQSGNVSLLAELGEIGKNSQFDLTLSFGKNEQASFKEGQASLARGYQTVLDNYNGKGEAIGWQDYLSSLAPLASLVD